MRPQGQDEPCYYCGKPCDIYAGNPSLWPLPLCHRDEPGVTKWHHTECISARLVENQPRHLLAILPPHTAGLSLRHNDHLCCYVTAKQHIADIEEMQHGECDFVSPEDRATAFATNELWELHWYPLTPVGAYTVYAATLEALIGWMTRRAAARWQGGI